MLGAVARAHPLSRWQPACSDSLTTRAQPLLTQGNYDCPWLQHLCPTDVSCPTSHAPGCNAWARSSLSRCWCSPSRWSRNGRPAARWGCAGCCRADGPRGGPPAVPPCGRPPTCSATSPGVTGPIATGSAWESCADAPGPPGPPSGRPFSSQLRARRLPPVRSPARPRCVGLILEMIIGDGPIFVAIFAHAASVDEARPRSAAASGPLSLS
jgi:hypothetical protein